MSGRILITGPIHGSERYAAAARTAGWEALDAPLLEVAGRALDPALLEPLPDLLVVTSSNALSALAPFADRLRSLRFATVGASAAERLSAWGLTPALPAAASATELAAALLEGHPSTERVLWPRGSLSDDLAQALRLRGIAVDDPIAYEVRPRALSQRLTDFGAVFFASPSAVDRYRQLVPLRDDLARTAFAIGATTAAALAREPFADMRKLSEPTPGALLSALGDVAPPHP